MADFDCRAKYCKTDDFTVSTKSVHLKFLFGGGGCSLEPRNLISLIGLFMFRKFHPLYYLHYCYPPVCVPSYLFSSNFLADFCSACYIPSSSYLPRCGHRKKISRRHSVTFVPQCYVGNVHRETLHVRTYKKYYGIAVNFFLLMP